MKKSKLLATFELFEQKELKKLKEFLCSPYFFTNGIPKDEYTLFEILYAYAPEFPELQFTKKLIFKAVYPNQIFTEGVLDKKMSSLLKKIEQFIAQEYMHKSDAEFDQSMILARFYRLKKSSKYYEINLNQIKKRQELKAKKGIDYLWREFQIQRETNQYLSKYKNTPIDDYSLEKTLVALQNFYLGAKLYYSSFYLYHSLFHKKLIPNNDDIVLNDPKVITSNKLLSKLPMFRIYSLKLKVLRKKKKGIMDMETFEQMENLIKNHEHQLPVSIHKDIQTFCRSFYLRQVTDGNFELMEKVFELYKEHLEKGLLFHEGGLPASVYRNIVSYGLKLGKFQWTFDFIHALKDKIIGSSNPEQLFYFNLADYNFKTKNYLQAKEYLAESYGDLYYQIIAKRLEIKIYYEENSPLLESKINAFRLFLLRLSKKQILDASSHFKGNKYFINIMKQIIHPKSFKNIKRINSLKEKISKTKVISEKYWLLEKLDTLSLSTY